MTEPPVVTDEGVNMRATVPVHGIVVVVVLVVVVVVVVVVANIREPLTGAASAGNASDMFVILVPVPGAPFHILAAQP